MKGKLIIISAPSGSGKTTIVHHLLSLDLNLAFSISATSRKPRSNEMDAVDYYFISPEDFRKKIDNDEFLEWEEVYNDQYYGTLKSEVKRLRNHGKHVVLDLDVVGGSRLKKQFGNDALALFVKAPSIQIMEERLRKRATDSENQIKKRITKATEELKYADEFDVILINDQLKDTLHEAESIIREFTGTNQKKV